MAIDWPGLKAAATEAAANAYAPYSHLQVGAAGLTSSGDVVVGCNVENASFGLTLCAECGLVSALHGAGQERQGQERQGQERQGQERQSQEQQGQDPPALVAVAVVAGDGKPLLPCGRCRQLLLEAGGPGLLVGTDHGPVELQVLLPAAFTSTDLASRKTREEPGA